MNIEAQVESYLASLPEPKQTDLRALHQLARQISPESQLWFTDGKNEDGKVVANPNIGYGLYAIQYADGTTRDFYQVGLSANKTGISVYIMGLPDKTHLANAYGSTIGKATVTGYCIRFRAVKDVNLDVLESAIRFGLDARNDNAY